MTMAIPNPVASFPVPSSDAMFRMGPDLSETGVDYWWNTQHDDGTYTACSEPEGWESVDYILPLDQVGGRDGALTGPQTVAPRELELEALIVSVSPQILREHLAAIRRIFGPQALPGPRLPVVWEQHDFASSRRLAMVTRPSGKLRFVVQPGYVEGGIACVIGFTLIASYPWKYQAGDIEHNEIGLLDPGALTGRTYDKTYDYSYGSGVPVGGSMQCLNQGDLSTWPVFIVTGPADYPIITNATTGQVFQVNYNLGAGETITIDSRSGQVTPGNVRLIGRPFPLVPGQNTITWRTQSSAYNADALLRLEWRSTST